MDAQKLILSLEAAAAGSEYLDYAIQRQFGLMKPVPAYTSSLDAAMSLVPPDWSIHRLGRRNDCRGGFTGWFAELYRAADVVLALPATAVAATAPLAIACAALRVREHLAEQGEAVPVNTVSPLRVVRGGDGTRFVARA